MLIIFSALFGLIAGSFLNVCIYRIPRDKSIVWPGSGCPACGAPIKFYDNIPVLSFILLAGKCRACGSKISWRYPLVEFLTAVLTVLFAVKFQGSWLWLGAALIAVYTLIAITFIDLDFFIIPDELSLGLAAFGLAASCVNPNFSGGPAMRIAASAGGLLAGGLLVWGIAEIGEMIFKKEAMGGGDVKLMAALGALLGWQGMLTTLMMGSFFGSVYGIGLLVLKKIERRGHIPFGPFLALGAVINLYRFMPLSAFLFP